MTHRKGADNRIRIGIASAFFYPGNSVIADFSGVIDRLDDEIFEIIYIYMNENNVPSPYLMAKKQKGYVAMMQTDFETRKMRV